MKSIFFNTMLTILILAGCAPAQLIPTTTPTPAPTSTPLPPSPTEASPTEASPTETPIPSSVLTKSDFKTFEEGLNNPKMLDEFKRLKENLPECEVYMTEEGYIVAIKPQTYPNYPNKQLVSPAIEMAGKANLASDGSAFIFLITQEFSKDYIATLHGPMAADDQSIIIPNLIDQQAIDEINRIIGNLIALKEGRVKLGPGTDLSKDLLEEPQHFMSLFGTIPEKAGLAYSLQQETLSNYNKEVILGESPFFGSGMSGLEYSRVLQGSDGTHLFIYMLPVGSSVRVDPPNLEDFVYMLQVTFDSLMREFLWQPTNLQEYNIQADQFIFFNLRDRRYKRTLELFTGLYDLDPELNMLKLRIDNGSTDNFIKVNVASFR